MNQAYNQSKNKNLPALNWEVFIKPIVGLEPTTYALRMRCSTNWAISAYRDLTEATHHIDLLYRILKKMQLLFFNL